MTRLNKILTGLVVVQFALAMFVVTRSGGSAEVTATPVLAGFDAAQVSRLQVFEAGSSKGVDLVKRGTSWVVASHWDYPADTTKIDAALGPLAKLTAGDPLATSSTKHKQLKVADLDFDKKLVITAGGKDTIVFFGTTKSRRTAVRIGGEERVLGATGAPVGALSGVARDWIAASYVDIPRDDIDKIEIVRGATKVELERSAAEPAGSGSASPRTWRVAIDGAPVVLGTGESLETFAIDTIVSDVGQVPAEPVDPKRDTSAPAAHVTVTRKGGQAVVLDVLESGPSWWIKQRGIERATSIDKTRFESVMAADRSKLVRKEVAPKPDAGSAAGMPLVPSPDFE